MLLKNLSDVAAISSQVAFHNSSDSDQLLEIEMLGQSIAEIIEWSMISLDFTLAGIAGVSMAECP
jgi:hypothetical protein